MHEASIARWQSPGWHEAALAWIDACLVRRGQQRIAPPGEQRIRSWATTIPVTTTHGRAWFKAASDVTAHEARMYPLLASLAPDVALTPLGIDPERAWMLLPDGGTSLLHALDGDALVSALIDILPRYARMQIALQGHVNDLLGAGAGDMRPQAMPARFDAALEACRPLVATGEEAVFEQVRALRPRYVAWCEQLQDAGIRASLDHSDLHTNNILLANPEDRGTARVYDWGDSVVAHPFSSMLVLLRQVCDALGAAGEDPRLARIRDAYLEPYAATMPGMDLPAVMDTACRVAIVTRATIWLRVLDLGPPPEPVYATAPWHWMKTLLQDSWLS